eukprot:TRINITY_DN17101_c0_g1_i1.p2 TRINITY_DN17101_c0_g1~~TRINITY_DN17101_c0_g1_i1.p2  ORF type:complete len:175 (-),score=30.50 TRINITY_DN17101_c0_g1_i1:95-619(-)
MDKMSSKDDAFVSPMDSVESPKEKQQNQQQNEEMENSEIFFTPIQSTPGGSFQSKQFLQTFQAENNKQDLSSKTPQIFLNNNNSNINNNCNLFEDNFKQQPWKQFSEGQLQDSIDILQNKFKIRENNEMNKNNNYFINDENVKDMEDDDDDDVNDDNQQKFSQQSFQQKLFYKQ